MSLLLKNRTSEIMGFIISLLLVNTFIGTLPFFLSPNASEWITGFAQALANNESIFDLFVRNIGYPHENPVAFGLPVAYVASLFIRIGFLPIDAQSLAYALFFSFAFYGAFFLAKKFTSSFYFSLFAALCWMLMPFIRFHLHFFMTLAVGMALMPAYIAINLCLFNLIEVKNKKILLLLYPLVFITAIFLDGYTFMMFAACAGACAFAAIIYRTKNVIYNIFTLAVTLLATYIMYTSYLGVSSYAFPIDTYRAFGLDLSFLFIPTEGVSFLADLFDFSVVRTYLSNWGDHSVWRSTFQLPLILLTCISFFFIKDRKLLLVFSLIALVGFYFSLGTDLKIFTSRPENSIAYMMPSEATLFPIGTELFYKYLPGFTAMRATYRWIALFSAGFWAICILCASDQLPRKYITLGFFAIILFNYPNRLDFLYPPSYNYPLTHNVFLNRPDYTYPNIISFLEEYSIYRNYFISMDETIIKDLVENTEPYDVVLFYPLSNDFSANYFASRAGIYSYNIGGDKNNEIARQFQPASIQNINTIVANEDFESFLLLFRFTDYIIFPNYSLYFTALTWNTDSVKQNNYLEILEDCNKDFINALLANELFTVHQSKYASYISINDEVFVEYLNNIDYPLEISGQSSNNLSSFLDIGWYPPEPTHVWSTSEAKLLLPIPSTVSADSYFILDYSVFAALEESPKELIVSTTINGEVWEERHTITSSDYSTVKIPVDIGVTLQEITIEIPNATSPSALGLSADERILGVALRAVDLIQAND